MLYQEKPVVIEAIRFDGSRESGHRIQQWAHVRLCGCDGETWLEVCTPRGPLRANAGDWIIRDGRGEFSPIKDSVFHKTYEPVHPDEAPRGHHRCRACGQRWEHADSKAVVVVRL